MIKVGLLGWGEMSAHFYHQIMQHAPEVTVMGISSTDYDILERFRSTSAVKIVESDYRRVIGFHDMDAVIIGHSQDRTSEMVVDALQAGVHVLLCHPPATNASEAMTIKARAGQYPTQFTTVALPYRFDANLESVRQLLKKNKIGTIGSIRYTARYPFTGLSPKVMSGLYMDAIVRDIDAISYVTGDYFVDVHARGSLRRLVGLSRSRDIDTAHISARMVSGIQVQMQVLRTDIQGPRWSIEIEGTEGTIIAMDYDWNPSVRMVLADQQIVKRTHMPHNAYLAIIKAFAQNIRDKRAPEPTLDAAIHAIKVAVSMAKSDVLREEVQISSDLA